MSERTREMRVILSHIEEKVRSETTGKEVWQELQTLGDVLAQEERAQERSADERIQWNNISSVCPPNLRRVLFKDKDGDIFEGFYSARSIRAARDGVTAEIYRYRFRDTLPLDRVSHWAYMPDGKINSTSNRDDWISPRE